MPVLFGSGPIAAQESALLVQVVLLMLVAAVPVFVLLFFFAWHYRAGNKKAKYEPHWEHARLDELVWWAVPFEIILVIGALTWSSTHALDPHKPIDSPTAPLEIQVVALPWKWLFIYPAQGIATVNYLALPTGVPVHFDITSDAPMNSFWIPALGGQIYAMTGMDNPLTLLADRPGTYDGYSANYSGAGFASMHFVAVAQSQADFDSWVAHAKLATSSTLDAAEYRILATPATTTRGYYGSITPTIFTAIVQQYDWGFAGGHH